MTVSIQTPASEAPAERPVEQTAQQTQHAPEATAQAQQPAQRPTTEERPSWLPEKFKTGEDLARSYAELESRLGQQTAQQAQQVEQQAQTAGVNIDAFNEEYARLGGRLSEESYATLAKAGFTRAVVDNYIAGQEAIAAADIAAVYAEVGGEQEFQKVQSWAKANLPRSALEAFNDVVNTGSRDALILAISGLQAKYVAANGREPKLVNGIPGSTVEGYRSRNEIIEAMRDPRYRKDEAYRADVTARLEVTPF